MCQDQVPPLSPRAAAERLAARGDVPELTAGVLGREHAREASHYLKTTPGIPAAPGWGTHAMGACKPHTCPWCEIERRTLYPALDPPITEAEKAQWDRGEGINRCPCKQNTDYGTCGH